MKRAVQVTKVSRRFAMEAGNPNTLVDLPPADWVVTGPRGGRYLATGVRTRTVGEMDGDFVMNRITVMDRSAGVAYIRPGSKLERELGLTPAATLLAARLREKVGG